MSRYTAPRAQQTRFTVPASKQRNPFVAAGLLRKAGSHGRVNERQNARRDLQKEIAEIGERSP